MSEESVPFRLLLSQKPHGEAYLLPLRGSKEAPFFYTVVISEEAYWRVRPFTTTYH